MMDTISLNVPFVFKRRPESLPPELRPLWRIATLLLILSASRGKRASLKKLHVINWAIRDAVAQDQLLNYLGNSAHPSTVVVRFEPALTQALAYGQAEGLWLLAGGKQLQLTDSGKDSAQLIENDQEVMTEEKAFISKLKPLMYENKIESLLMWEA